MWGPPRSIEVQLLLLIETKLTSLGVSTEVVDGVASRFAKFVRERYPGSVGYLADAMGLENWSSPEFMASLAEFLTQEGRRGLGEEQGRFVPTSDRWTPRAV